MKSLVIFDLDGTLLNSIADLAQSTNHALASLGLPTHPTPDYRFMVGNGIDKLFERALPQGCKTPQYVQRMRQLFLEHYALHNAELSHPYPGILEMLEQLQVAGVRLAVASNKYQAATEQLVRHFFASTSFVAVFGQRTGVPAKPDPTVVHDILQLTGTPRQAVLYVGDSAVDMQTARGADVESCGVTWGFRPRTELEAEHPAHIVDAPQEIVRLALG